MKEVTVLEKQVGACCIEQATLINEIMENINCCKCGNKK